MRKDSSYGDVRILEVGACDVRILQVGEVSHEKIEVCPEEEPRLYVWCIKDIYIEMVLQNCVLDIQVEALESWGVGMHLMP